MTNSVNTTEAAKEDQQDGLYTGQVVTPCDDQDNDATVAWAGGQSRIMRVMAVSGDMNHDDIKAALQANRFDVKYAVQVLHVLPDDGEEPLNLFFLAQSV